MPRNIEIKARIENIEQLKEMAESISDGDGIEILQDDTFFTCVNGRLKLRAFGDGTGALIFYQTANEKGPKESLFTTAPTHASDALRETLPPAFGQSGASGNIAHCSPSEERASIWTVSRDWVIFWSWKSCWRMARRLPSASKRPTQSWRAWVCWNRSLWIAHMSICWPADWCRQNA
jgi:hypothetical protein